MIKLLDLGKQVEALRHRTGCDLATSYSFIRVYRIYITVVFGVLFNLKINNLQ